MSAKSEIPEHDRAIAAPAPASTTSATTSAATAPAAAAYTPSAVSVAAYEAAADYRLFPDAGEPWAVSKLYYNHGFLRQRMQLLQDEFAEEMVILDIEIVAPLDLPAAEPAKK